MKTWLAIGVLACVAAGCSGVSESYVCATDDNCAHAGARGACSRDPDSDRKYCAFPDLACESGLRWDNTAASELRTLCTDGGDGGVTFDGGNGMSDASGNDAALDPTIDAAPADAAVLDLTRPTIISRLPDDGFTNRSPSESIVVMFSEPILSSSVTASSFVVTASGSSVLGTRMVSGAMLTFTALQPHALLQTISVRVTTAITDVAGNALAADASWTFTVRDGLWSSPVPIQTGNMVTRPVIAMNRAGDVVVAWSAASGGRADLYASRRKVGAGWEGPLLVSDQVASVDTPAAVIDAAGNAIIVWMEPDGGVNSVWSSRLARTATSFGAPVRLETGAGAAYLGVLSPVAGDGAGNAIVVWQQVTGGSNNDLLWNRYDVALGAWSGVQPKINANGNQIFNASVEMDSAGNAAVLWEERIASPMHDELRVSMRMATGSAWSSPTSPQAAGRTLSAQWDTAAMQLGGRLTVAWQETSASPPTQIWVNTLMPPGTWATPQAINVAQVTTEQPWVAVSSTGRTIVTWSQVTSASNNTRQAWAAHYDLFTGPTGALAANQRLDALSTFVQQNGYVPQVPAVVDDDGNAVAVWMQDATPFRIVFASRFVAATSQWTPPGGANLSASIHDARDPILAIDGMGRVVVAWRMPPTGGTQDNIYVAEFR
ncbi:MAG: Ig-like domain-containing protein [Deltaproteobacteria bacterium]|nr:Ig-like domain-containing protein [Deltaproteobacteria bacterium]